MTSQQEPITGSLAERPETWKPRVAGVLIVVGSVLVFLLWTTVAAELGYSRVFGFVFGIGGVYGGIEARKRRSWGVAMLGAFFSSLSPPSALLGIAAMIMLARSKGEFGGEPKSTKKPRSTAQKIGSGVAIIVAVVAFVVVYLGAPGFFDESAKSATDSRILRELEENGNPTGMFGATWYMSQEEVKDLFGDVYQLDADILGQATEFLGRPIEASYHFREDRLWLITVSFKEQISSLNQLSDRFYLVERDLSQIYGPMRVPRVHEPIPPVDGVWPDQELVESEKRMGHATLLHRVAARNNGIGEQIIMSVAINRD